MSVLVTVELVGPSSLFVYRCLGSLTERYGMRVSVEPSSPNPVATIPVLISVPDAHTRRDAEAIVSACLDWIRRAAPGDSEAAHRATTR